MQRGAESGIRWISFTPRADAGILPVLSIRWTSDAFIWPNRRRRRRKCERYGSRHQPVRVVMLICDHKRPRVLGVMIRREALAHSQVDAMPALRARVVPGNLNRFAFGTKNFSHCIDVPNAPTLDTYRDQRRPARRLAPG
jgi:hypothetical protein